MKAEVIFLIDFTALDGHEKVHEAKCNLVVDLDLSKYALSITLSDIESMAVEKLRKTDFYFIGGVKKFEIIKITIE